MILAMDMGGTEAKMALIRETGEITARHSVSTCVDRYSVPVLDCAVRGIAEFMGGLPEKPEGIAVCATGQIDPETGTVTESNGTIPDYTGTRIRDRLKAEFHLPVSVLNDANAAVLGECAFGAAKGRKDVIMLTLGTGVGGGVVIGGRLFTGSRGIGGELGQYTLDRNGPLCPCGMRGTYEYYASVTALVRAAEAAAGETGLNGREIFARAARGDAAMLGVLDRWQQDIAAGLAGLVHIFNPERVIVGGGVCAQKELLMDPLREKAMALIIPSFRGGLDIVPAALGNDAGLMGAVCFWRERYGK